MSSSPADLTREHHHFWSEKAQRIDFVPSMRLLNVRTLDLVEFRSGHVPPYAIASHRWNTGQEASLKDIQKRQNVDYPGYKKVVGFSEYVKAHISGLEWLWIDTCCIDNRSSQEVSEAVNSMFRWYRHAAVCLAFLSDVDTLQTETVVQSEWFKRGWTLQELLAPTIVVFLTRSWDVIGHKGYTITAQTSDIETGPSLDTIVSSITKIPTNILNDYAHSKHCTINEKLAWTLGRETTREEDLSYCLFGIFDVAIGANYGEGERWARSRLLRAIRENLRETDTTVGRTTSDSPPLSMENATTNLTSSRNVRKIAESFAFPQMNDRRDHIQKAYQGTYQWALLSNKSADIKWDNFVVWLADPHATSRIYWVNAKPGAGKSSLLRFLDENLVVDRHMQPWAGVSSVLRVHHYFWRPGNVLQKSLVGFLRTILHQLYQMLPNLLSSTVPHSKFAGAETVRHAGDISWSTDELQSCLRKFIIMCPTSTKLLLLIDGLDEVDGDEDGREELMKLLGELTASPKVKACVSSRRWTTFEDTFAKCPQLRLEDLNSRDIESYVQGNFLAQTHFEQMLKYDPSAHDLIKSVIWKAEGVFLWTRLVVKDLVRGIRDGDNYQTLRSKLQAMPRDLNGYFGQLIDSIEPHHRREACTMLQIALYDEQEFTALLPLRLVDLIFTQDAHHDFALFQSRNDYVKNFNDAEVLLARLDSTVRRLSSLCKGLLECYFDMGSTVSDFEIEGEADGEQVTIQWYTETLDSSSGKPSRTVTSLSHTLLPVLRRHKYAALDFHVDFMHRSLRDYLLEPEPTQFLHHHTDGAFDARNYLRNSRLVQIFMATNAGLNPGLSLGLASYYLSTLSEPSFRNDPRCAPHMAAFQPLLPLLTDAEFSTAASFWYLCASLNSWHREQSNRLTLAIDFGLTAYLARSLSSTLVREKRGRPLLDYVLRPRFADFLYWEHTSIGLQYSDAALVRMVLGLGANPNEIYKGISLWPLFLSFVAGTLNPMSDRRHARQEKARRNYFLSLEMMIKSGASNVVTRSELNGDIMHGMTMTTSRRSRPYPFSLRWPGLSEEANRADNEAEQFGVADVLECFRPMFGDRIGRLKGLASRQGDGGLSAIMDSTTLK